MKYKLLITISLFLLGFTSNAQELQLSNNRAYDYYIGVQANNLIKQILNSNSTGTGNPYSVNLSMDSKKTGWGFRMGIGYGHGNGNNNLGTELTNSSGDDLQLRLGIERAYSLSKRWSAGAGFDFVLNSNNDFNYQSVYSTNSIGQADTLHTGTRTLAYSMGGGLMGWLRFKISEHLLIGTESSFYYIAGMKKQTVSYNQWTGIGYVDETSTTNKGISQGAFTAPIAIFIHVKF